VESAAVTPLSFRVFVIKPNDIIHLGEMI
jgi:hypothetical protein